MAKKVSYQKVVEFVKKQQERVARKQRKVKQHTCVLCKQAESIFEEDLVFVETYKFHTHPSCIGMVNVIFPNDEIANLFVSKRMMVSASVSSNIKEDIA
jgi:hypothetical protein